jgi:hypothetical protein
MRHFTRLLAAALGFGIVFSGSTSQAIDGGGIDTVFAIRKSTNDNQVDYGIMLDAQCHPRTDTPVVGYFRRQTGSIRDLSLVERTVYGVGTQRVASTDTGGTVDFRLRAVSDRTIRIVVTTGARGCVARAITRVNGERSELTDIYVVLAGPRSVDHVEVTGRTISGSRTVREDIRD